MGGVFKGLFIFVQVKDRSSDSVRKDIRTIQQHGGIATAYADNPKITHCLVTLPSSKPQPYFIRTFDEAPYKLPNDFHQRTCDHLLYYFTFGVGSRNPRVVQTEWLYESISARKSLGPEEAWGGWRIRCELRRSSRPSSVRDPLQSNPSVKDNYPGPVRDILKDPRLNGKLLKASRDTQDDDSRQPSHAKSESSEEDEPLRKRRSLRKRTIHSFTPSPHHTSRPSPPKSPVELTVKASPKSPLSFTSLESHVGKASVSPHAASAHKPNIPPIKVNIPFAQSRNVPTAPSRCYVPRSAHSGTSSGQQTAATTTSKASAESKDSAPCSRISADRMTPLSEPASASVSISGAAAIQDSAAPVAPAPPAFTAAPTPSTAAQASTVSRTGSSVPKATLSVSVPESSCSSVSLTPLPSPTSVSTDPAAVSAVPVRQEQPAPATIGQPRQVAPAPPASMLPTPVTPAAAAPPSVLSVAASTQTVPRQPERAEAGLLAPRNPPQPFRMFLSEGLKRGTRNIVNLGKASEVPLHDADYVIVSSDATKRSLPGPAPQWAVVVDEAWLHDSFLNDELQNVRDYFVDLPATPASEAVTLAAPSASASPSASMRKRKSSTLFSAEPVEPPKPKSRAPKRPAPAPEPEPEEEDMVIDVDDSDDESYVGSGDEGDEADGDDDTSAPVRKDPPNDADISNVYWLVDELLKWDKRGSIRHQLERCSRDVGIPNARKLYYTYKEFIKENVPDLRARRPYKKRARTQ